MTTDSFVVKPLRFPGGSIGELAINGTVNDLAVSGARAEAIVVTFVLEAGLPTDVLEAEVRAMAQAAEKAGVRIAGGDTKVVEHGKADHMYITTTGIGRLLSGVEISPHSVRPGDKVLLSGPIGDHGITILLARGDLDLEAELRSDTRSVFPLVQAMVHEAGAGVRWMRDPTRGGVATSLNELARDCGLGHRSYSRKRFPCAIPCAAPANFWASIRCISRTKDNFSLSFPRNWRKPRCRPCAQPPEEKNRGNDRRNSRTTRRSASW